MGAMYHAHDLLVERDVALKVMLPQLAGDPEQKARFEREATFATTRPWLSRGRTARIPNGRSGPTTFFRRSSREKPDFIPAYVMLGALYWAGNFVNRATAMYRKALQLDPGQAGGDWQCGNAGDLAQAEAAVSTELRTLVQRSSAAPVFGNDGIGTSRAGLHAPEGASFIQDGLHAGTGTRVRPVFESKKKTRSGCGIRLTASP